MALRILAWDNVQGRTKQTIYDPAPGDGLTAVSNKHTVLAADASITVGSGGIAFANLLTADLDASNFNLTNVAGATFSASLAAPIVSVTNTGTGGLLALVNTLSASDDMIQITNLGTGKTIGTPASAGATASGSLIFGTGDNTGSANSGDLTLSTGAAPVGQPVNSGNIFLQTGVGGSNGSGNITLTTGDVGDNGSPPGSFNLTTGNSAATSFGFGGNAAFVLGSGFNDPNGQGGTFSVNTGSCNPTGGAGTGGNVVFLGGNGGDTGGTGGSFSFTGGQADIGGSVTFIGGNGLVTNGGDLFLVGGQSMATAVRGGRITIQGGAGFSGSDPAGSILLQTQTGTGGTITLDSGSNATAVTADSISLTAASLITLTGPLGPLTRSDSVGTAPAILQSVTYATLAASTGNQVPLGAWVTADVAGVHVDYTIRDTVSGAVRVGTYKLAQDGSTFSFVDASNQTADVGVTVVPAFVSAGSGFELQFTTGANSKHIHADVRTFRR